MSTVSITYLKVADQPPPAWWWRALCPAEKKRADAFQFSSDRNAYISAHALLRHKLAKATGIAPAELRFSQNSFGKPALENTAAPFGFNLSHTRGMVAVAMAPDCAVGVDVEAVTRTVSGDLAIAEQNFTSAEIRALRETRDPHSRRSFFFWLWTRKEAVLKATGKGLSLPLNSFCVVGDGDHPINITLSCGASRQASLSSKNLNEFCISAAILSQGDIPSAFLWEKITSESVLKSGNIAGPDRPERAGRSGAE